MSNMTIIDNKDFGSIRAVTVNGEGWLSGKDVATILGYKDTDKALRDHVDNEDKRLFKPADLAGLTEDAINKGFHRVGINFNFTLGEIPNRGMYFVNESGVYALTFDSKLPKAKAFRRWVTSEVLPSLRKTGAYVSSNATPLDDARAIQLLIQQNNKLMDYMSETNRRMMELLEKLSSKEVRWA